MLKINDRVRFLDPKKNKMFGVLIIFDIKGEIATLGNGDYETLGQSMSNAKLSELKNAL